MCAWAERRVAWERTTRCQEARSLVSSRARGVVSVLRPWAECLWEGGRCQVVWTKDTLAEVLEFVGFRVVLHEYYDSKGNFHMNKVFHMTYEQGLASARGGSCTTAPAPDPGSTPPPRVCALCSYTPMRSRAHGILNPRPQS